VRHGTELSAAIIWPQPKRTGANILRDYFGTFRACSGPLALFRSNFKLVCRRAFTRQLLKTKDENGRSGEI
jgi:hypothetical protein